MKLPVGNPVFVETLVQPYAGLHLFGSWTIIPRLTLSIIYAIDYSAYFRI